MTVTIDEVARAARVSRSTVSLVARGSDRVAAQTQERVREAIARLGYRPNRLAAGLRSKRSRTIGLVVSSLAYPHHARIALGVEQALDSAGYSVFLANSRGSAERERQHIETLRRASADGLLIAPLQLEADDAAHLQALHVGGYPVVTVYREVPGLAVDFCGVDAYASVREVVAHLADLGHRRIAFAPGEARTPIAALRLSAWRDELGVRGLDVDERLAVQPNRDQGRYAGEAAVEWLLAQGVPFTAIVGTNDFLALGALRALHRAGRRVPEDVSVAGIGGFDDLASPEKPLTTLVHDYERIGLLAGEMVLRRVARAWRQDVERRIVPGTLYVGETTGPCPSPTGPQRTQPIAHTRPEARTVGETDPLEERQS